MKVTHIRQLLSFKRQIIFSSVCVTATQDFHVLLTVHPELRVKRNQLILSIFVNRYMFRAYLGPSSGATTVCIQQLALIILFRWLSVVLGGLQLVLFRINSGCGTGRSGSVTGITLPIYYRLRKATRNFTRPELRKNMCQIPVYSITIKQNC